MVDVNGEYIYYNGYSEMNMVPDDAFALQLNTTTAIRLLHKAGYALSDSDDFDKVMKFCLDSRTFNLDDVDQMLIAYDLQDEVFLEENKPRGKRK